MVEGSEGHTNARNYVVSGSLPQRGPDEEQNPESRDPAGAWQQNQV